MPVRPRPSTSPRGHPVAWAWNGRQRRGRCSPAPIPPAPAAAPLSRTGQLEVDPETDSSGARFVTRTSVEAYYVGHRRASPRGDPAGVPVGEVARFAGLSERDVLDLVHDGVLEQVPGRRRREITIASLRCWLTMVHQPKDSSRHPARDDP